MQASPHPSPTPSAARIFATPAAASRITFAGGGVTTAAALNAAAAAFSAISEGGSFEATVDAIVAVEFETAVICEALKPSVLLCPNPRSARNPPIVRIEFLSSIAGGSMTR